jgi:hypothetical protein
MVRCVFLDEGNNYDPTTEDPRVFQAGERVCIQKNPDLRKFFPENQKPEIIHGTYVSLSDKPDHKRNWHMIRLDNSERPLYYHKYRVGKIVETPSIPTSPTNQPNQITSGGRRKNRRLTRKKKSRKTRSRRN